MWHWHAIYTIHVYIQDTPLEWPCLQTKIRNYRYDRSKIHQNTMDLYYTHTWLRYGLQPGHIIGLPPPHKWTTEHLAMGKVAIASLATILQPELA